jgi:hypothetical protein
MNSRDAQDLRRLAAGAQLLEQWAVRYTGDDPTVEVPMLAVSVDAVAGLLAMAEQWGLALLGPEQYDAILRGLQLAAAVEDAITPALDDQQQ